MTGYLWRGRPDLERVNAQIMADRGDSGHEPPDVLFQWGRAFCLGTRRPRPERKAS